MFNNIKAFNGFAMRRWACSIAKSNMDPREQQPFGKNTDMTSVWI